MVNNQIILLVIIVILVIFIVYFFRQEKETFGFTCNDHAPCHKVVNESCNPNKGEINAYCNNNGRCRQARCDAFKKKWYIYYDL